MAIAASAIAAQAVLNGEVASDLFVQAKKAVEALTEQVFASDEEAAIAILEMSTQE